MEEFGTYEFSVLRGTDSKIAVYKFLLILLYIGFVLLWLAFGLITRWVPLLALIPVTLWMLIFFTWRYTKVEYEYSVTSGTMTLSVIYGNRSRKKIGEYKLKEMTALAPCSDKSIRTDIEKSSGRIIYMIPKSDLDAGDTDTKSVEGKAFAATFGDDIVLFRMTERMFKICRFYNPSVLVSCWNKRS